MQEKIDDLENRSRRSNVLFYGISDTNKSEASDVSERLASEFCTNKLGISVSTIARAHRIGRFSPVKPRPIIAKLFNEKEVETVMANGFKLKNTTFSVSRDYSEAVRDIQHDESVSDEDVVVMFDSSSEEDSDDVFTDSDSEAEESSDDTMASAREWYQIDPDSIPAV
ncbi:hypothetical protein HPB49_004308 [Dermacentor silvarum]|uniref:Uncharacterized protein n=1 Tax=Dermacentor silvarum TaxID=543639 RepID=A0ACB8DU76_DERSI|nr:hypothetical protein HPB49_004308 [Dermacentor silvarum]